MEIIRGLKGLTRRPYPVAALGNFDGVHLGHRAILKTAADRAHAKSGTAYAITFEPAPARVLFPERAPRLILTPEDKLEFLRQSGIDGVIVLEFTRELSQLEPRDFVREYLIAGIGVREIVVGHSVSFGHNRAGNAAVMKALGREMGFETDVVGPIKAGGIEVSSTKVRQLIAAGDLRGAAKLLGRDHFLRGTVVHGRERGRTIGFPTANLESETECIPPDGVYASRVVVADGAHPAITNIGMRPTFAETVRSIEAHIFDFNRDIYGERIKLELVERIRPEQKFDSADALKHQIELDLRKVREILSAA
ncbi:MAG TPA: bifunctional riboflavin kinase/FAD synthetase [Candidatus Binataceae bacterium]|nr:bifunctional riboflavin kinase/FAD synthetase [Candidatus Binataceae bacterium]